MTLFSAHVTQSFVFCKQGRSYTWELANFVWFLQFYQARNYSLVSPTVLLNPQLVYRQHYTVIPLGCKTYNAPWPLLILTCLNSFASYCTGRVLVMSVILSSESLWAICLWILGLVPVFVSVEEPLCPWWVLVYANLCVQGATLSLCMTPRVLWEVFFMRNSVCVSMSPRVCHESLYLWARVSAMSPCIYEPVFLPSMSPCVCMPWVLVSISPRVCHESLYLWARVSAMSPCVYELTLYICHEPLYLWARVSAMSPCIYEPMFLHAMSPCIYKPACLPWVLVSMSPRVCHESLYLWAHVSACHEYLYL